MNFFPDFKTVVTFGGFQITWYALFILGGALLAYFLSLKAFKKRVLMWKYLRTSSFICYQ